MHRKQSRTPIGDVSEITFESLLEKYGGGNITGLAQQFLEQKLFPDEVRVLGEEGGTAWLQALALANKLHFDNRLNLIEGYLLNAASRRAA